MSDINDIKVSGIEYFKEISAIPRGSGNSEAISEYLFKFGQGLGLKTIKDDSNNIIIFKEGTGTSTEPIILQGHYDMVCEKDSSSNHDFLKDGIKLLVDGDYIHADRTTLGADNGVAVSFAMELLADNSLKHPPLEVIFTCDEETSMVGAHNLDMTMFKSKRMINIDNEHEGVYVVSCAGGQRIDLQLPITYIECDKNLKAYEININGLLGGHSGMDVSKEKANANKLIGRVLCEILNEAKEFAISQVSGGQQDNAIPRESVAKVLVNKDFDMKALIAKMQENFNNEYELSDKDINIDLTETEVTKCLSLKDSKRIISSILLMPNGIQNMNCAIKGLAETSTNLGVLINTDDKFILRSALRSSMPSRLELMKNTMIAIAHSLDGVCNINKPYPGWKYQTESKMRDILMETYKEQTGEEGKIEAIHAGLECGIFASKIKDIDIISLGPTLVNPHTSKEAVDYKSMQRTYDLLTLVLEKLS